MNRFWLLLGLATALLAAALAVNAVDPGALPDAAPPDGPLLSEEERAGRLLRTLVARVIEAEIEPKAADAEGTRVVDGSRGTATVRRRAAEDGTDLTIQFDGYVLLLDPEAALENEIQVRGEVVLTRLAGGGGLRVRSEDVQLAVLDVRRRDPRRDAAGRFSFDLRGPSVAGLSGAMVHADGRRLAITPAPAGA